MAINRVLNDNDLQHRLIQAGLKNVERFSWEESARKVLDVYKKLLSENVNKDKF
jgi:glycosyltransferase involved in cell wall biosynthesis